VERIDDAPDGSKQADEGGDGGDHRQIRQAAFEAGEKRLGRTTHAVGDARAGVGDPVRHVDWRANDDDARALIAYEVGAGAWIGKLALTNNLRRISDLVSLVLGPRLVADSGEWGTFAWAEFVLGQPGMSIAGGTDEILKNIVGERVLGLPKEPRVDK